MVLRELLVTARELKGWSQRELGKRSGVGHVVIAQIELGLTADPGFSNVVKLADALGLPVERFAATVRTFDINGILRKRPLTREVRR